MQYPCRAEGHGLDFTAGSPSASSGHSESESYHLAVLTEMLRAGKWLMGNAFVGGVGCLSGFRLSLCLFPAIYLSLSLSISLCISDTNTIPNITCIPIYLLTSFSWDVCFSSASLCVVKSFRNPSLFDTHVPNGIRPTMSSHKSASLF